MTDSRPTAERILDAAEALFARHGYQGTSMGDIAARVGVRPPSLYNHFRGKEALYGAVLERLMAHFQPLIGQAVQGSATDRESALRWARSMAETYFDHPNFARLLQHAALAPTPHARALLTEFLRPLFEPAASGMHLPPPLQPWGAMDFNNLLISYITLAPLYRPLLDIDPLSPEARERQVEMVLELVDSALTRRPAGNVANTTNAAGIPSTPSSHAPRPSRRRA
ncbi:MAG: TetR/AcrR family transcriptional regulator [Proteobacteria bacterium]|nr:TetR/AcrR family transcriptional regulator [Pseudomonadota bacterium]HQR05077.1 TetR/AcrR family transcriptional regulator [Rhodocyclaceae bacterium]